MFSCKFIYTENNGYCLTKRDFRIQGDNYVAKHLNIKINKLNYEIFLNSNYKFFYAVKGSDNLYHLKGLNRDEIRSAKKGEFKQEYKPVKYESYSSFQDIGKYPIENVVIKKYEKVNFDVIKEVAIYKLFKTFTCMPHFYNFLFDNKNCKDVSIVIEKGITSLQHFDLDRNSKLYKSISFNLVKCLKVFQSQGIFHCDLKPLNIIVVNSKDGIKPQIIDWATYKIDYCPDAYQNQSFMVQTPGYESPELLAEVEYNYKIDIFTLGIVYLNMTSKQTPDNVFALSEYNGMYLSKLLKISNDFDIKIVIRYEKPLHKIIKYNLILNALKKDKNNNQLLEPYNAIKSLFNEKIFEDKSDAYNLVIQEIDKLPSLSEEEENFYDLVSHMLEFNPKLRYSYDDIILHPYFQNIKRESCPQFPIFMNKMPKIDLSKMPKKAFDTRLERIDTFKDFFYNDIKFTVIQLYDIMSYLFEYPLEKEYLLYRIAMLLGQSLHDHMIEIDYENDFDSKNIMFFLNRMDNIIYPSLYSYFIHYNKRIMNNEDGNKLLDLYKNPDVYIAFDKTIEKIKKDSQR